MTASKKTSVKKPRTKKKAKRIPPQAALLITDDQLVTLQGTTAKATPLPTGLVESGIILQDTKLGAQIKIACAHLSASARKNLAVVLPSTLFEWAVVQQIETPSPETAEQAVLMNLDTYAPNLSGGNGYRRQALATPRSDMPGSYRVMIAAIERQQLAAIYRALSAAGVNAVKIEPRLTAELRAATELSDGQPALVIHLEPGATHVVGIYEGAIISDEGLQRLERTLLSVTEAPNLRQAMQNINTSPEQLGSVMEDLLTATDDIKTTFSPVGLAQPQDLIVSGYGALTENVAHYLHEAVLTTVTPVNPEGLGALIGTLSRRGGGLCDVNPHDASMASTRDGLNTKQLGYLAIIAPITIAATLIAVTNAMKAAQEGRIRQIQAQIDELKPTIAEQQRLEKRNQVIDQTMAKKDQIENLKKRWPQYLDQIAQRFPNEPIGIDSLNSAESRDADTRQFDGQAIEALWQASGTAQSRSALITMLSAFEGAPFVVSISDVNSGENGVVKYNALIGIRQGSGIGMPTGQTIRPSDAGLLNARDQSQAISAAAQEDKP